MNHSEAYQQYQLIGKTYNLQATCSMQDNVLSVHYDFIIVKWFCRTLIYIASSVFIHVLMQCNNTSVM